MRKKVRMNAGDQNRTSAMAAQKKGDRCRCTGTGSRDAEPLETVHMQSRPRGPDKAELGRIRKADGNLLGFPRVAAGKAVGNSAMMDQAFPLVSIFID